jgi:Predicted membrane-bound metal-dependent hydrolases
MASPIAHSFAGFWTFLSQRGHLKTQPTAHWRQYLLPLGVLILLANAPDSDLFLGNALHRGFTHSLTVAILASLALGCAWRIAPGFWRSTILYFTAYSSHLLIDFFTGTKLGWTNSGFGMPLFWPWPKTFSSPLILIFGIHHKNFAALFSLDNVWACTYETVTFGAITVVASVLWKRKLKSRILGKRKLKSRTDRPTSKAPTHLLSNLQYQKRGASTGLSKLQDQK